MTFSVLGATPRPEAPRKLPGLLDSFAAPLGEGLGQGINKGIKDALEQSALERALGMIKPNSSVLDQYMALSRAQTPEARNFVAANVLPQLQQEQQIRQQQAQEQALSNLLTGQTEQSEGNSELGQTRSAEFNATKQPSQALEISGKKPKDITKTKEFKILSPANQMKAIEFQQKQRDKEEKESQKFHDETMAGLSAYNNERVTLERMEQLNKSNRLTNPLQSKVAQSLNMPFLLSPESQEFQKLTNEFLKNIRPLLGSQVSAGEVNLYLQGVPSLSNTKKGRERVIKNMKQMNDLRRVQADLEKEIIRENGYRPANLESQVKERMQPYFDDIIEEIKSAGGPKVIMTKNGKKYKIDEDKVQLAEKLGYSK